MDTKWTPGASYAPTLSTTDIYLLGVNGGMKHLELHPVLTHSLPSFHLVFNLANGEPCSTETVVLDLLDPTNHACVDLLNRLVPITL